MKTLFKRTLIFLFAGLLAFGSINAMARTSASGQHVASKSSCVKGKKCKMNKKSHKKMKHKKSSKKHKSKKHKSKKMSKSKSNTMDQ